MKPDKWSAHRRDHPNHERREGRVRLERRAENPPDNCRKHSAPGPRCIRGLDSPPALVIRGFPFGGDAEHVPQQDGRVAERIGVSLRHDVRPSPGGTATIPDAMDGQRLQRGDEGHHLARFRLLSITADPNLRSGGDRGFHAPPLYLRLEPRARLGEQPQQRSQRGRTHRQLPEPRTAARLTSDMRTATSTSSGTNPASCRGSSATPYLETLVPPFAKVCVKALAAL